MRNGNAIYEWIKARFPVLKDDSAGKVFGSTCRSFFIKHGIRSDILQHMKINKHKVAVSKEYSSQNFILFLTTMKDERGHHAADGLSVVHIKHNLTFWRII